MRFRDHTIKIFDQHGMKSIAYWVPTEEPEKSNTLVYILYHPSREAAAANWKSFQDDPNWKSVKEKSEANGKIVEKVDSTYMALADFSPPLRYPSPTDQASGYAALTVTSAVSAFASATSSRAIGSSTDRPS